MTTKLLIAALAAALATPGAAAAAPPAKKAAQPARPAARDWTKTVVVTPEGGFRMGNPAAPVKVVEYGSMTCPTCARFSKGAKAPLAARIRSGKLSFEFRNFVLNGLDLAASLLARCAGPAGFFPLTDAMFAAQPQWLGKAGALTDAQRKALEALPENARLGHLSDLVGLTQMAAAAGMPAPRAKACVADEAGVNRLVEMHQAAAAAGVTGTPTFLVNGARVHAHDWAELDPLIRQAGG